MSTNREQWYLEKEVHVSKCPSIAVDRFTDYDEVVEIVSKGKTRSTLERIMQAARERGCILDVNAHPHRLDLTDVVCKMAKDMGLMIAISTDAHGRTDLEYLSFGLDQGRRGWLEAKDIVTTRPLSELRRLMARK
jgi:histidinol phosphatase-like PHP family hydrolase